MRREADWFCVAQWREKRGAGDARLHASDAMPHASLSPSQWQSSMESAIPAADHRDTNNRESRQGGGGGGGGMGGI